MSTKSSAEKRIDEWESWRAETIVAEGYCDLTDIDIAQIATALRLAELSKAGCEVKIEPVSDSVRRYHCDPDLVIVRVRKPGHPEITTDSGVLRTLPAAVAVAHNRALALLEASGLLPDEG